MCACRAHALFIALRSIIAYTCNSTCILNVEIIIYV